MTKPEMDRRGPKMPLALCLIAIAAPGLSCSGSAEEADPYEDHYERPTREESVSFLAALRDMESSRTDTGESPRVFFFEDTSLEAAWDTARWEVPALKSWPEFNEQIDPDTHLAAWFSNGTPLSVTARSWGGSPQEALLKAMDDWVESVTGFSIEMLADNNLRSSFKGKLGSFEFEYETVHHETSSKSTTTTRRRISRSGQSYSSVTKMEFTDSATGDYSGQGGFFPKTDGLELTDIVRGLIEDSAPAAFSIIFLSSNEGEYYRYMAYVTNMDLSKSK